LCIKIFGYQNEKTATALYDLATVQSKIGLYPLRVELRFKKAIQILESLPGKKATSIINFYNGPADFPLPTWINTFRSARLASRVAAFRKR
jgi:hypothetical protein